MNAPAPMMRKGSVGLRPRGSQGWQFSNGVGPEWSSGGVWSPGPRALVGAQGFAAAQKSWRGREQPPRDALGGGRGLCPWPPAFFLSS